MSYCACEGLTFRRSLLAACSLPVGEILDYVVYVKNFWINIHSYMNAIKT